VLDGATVLPNDTVDSGEVLEEKVQEGRNARSVPPISLEISSDGELGHDVDTSFPHTSIGMISSASIEGTRGVGVGEDSVTGLKKGQRDEHGANISDDTADDDLFLSGGLDGSTEVGVVPGIDLPAPADDGGVGVHFSNLREEGTVGALICASGDDNGEVVGLAQTSMEENVVLHVLGVVVPDDAHETDLVVDDE